MPKSITPTAREREVYRYYTPLDVLAPSTPQSNNRELARSSTDPVLTAFAQLGAHRLSGKRGLITLSTRDTEYILAEATVGLGLQQDNDKNDPLWHGAVALKENCGLGMDLVAMFSGTGEDVPKYLCFEDLTLHETFKHKCIVEEEPHIRFLACVPLRSTLHSMVIGTYMVVDDKPRSGLSEDEIDFLLDIGVTVMDHLESQRLNQKQYRAERMVKAIGLFVEGKSTLRDWWLEGGHKFQNTKVKKRLRNGSSLDGQADLEFGIQDPSEELPAPLTEGNSNHLERPSLSRSPSSSTLSHVDRGGDGRPMLVKGESSYTTTNTNPTSVFSRGHLPSTSSSTTFDTSEGTVPADTARHSSIAFDLPVDSPNAELSKELQEALLTKDLKAVFGRASNLIREAGGVDGSIFFDASIGSFGAASQKDIMDQRAPGTFEIDETITTSEDETPRRLSESDTHVEECCSILGFSTRKRSSLRGHAPPPEHHTFPERILRTLLKRYPHGKVFNFEEDGSFSSSDTDNSYPQKDNTSDGTPRRLISLEKTARKRISREAEAEALLKALPGARSVFWFPLWDQARERWYAASLVWSTKPTRILCPIEDLTYLAAFGNSIMAEVSRLSALVLTQIKSDFISSISHELRSPLHGVLASVEFLQETDLNEMQADMIGNISASGRVLLDTINHILDFTKVNKRVQSKSTLSRSRNSKKQRLSVQEGDKNLDNTTKDTSNVCILSEEVVGSVYAGRNMKHSTTDGLAPILKPTESPLIIIMDIQWQPNWTFEIDAGAWRRIVLNLFGNSLKYTAKGFIKVSLAIETDSMIRGKKVKSMLVLKVKDSGKGISKEFLKHHLYKPFTQEDSLAVGAGLGLSIVRHIVQDLAGDINFVSEPGVGTEATVRLPVTLPIVSSAAQLLDQQDSVAEVSRFTRGQRFSLEGFDRYPDITETPTGILSADFEGAMFLKSSIHLLLTEWYGMEPIATSSTVDRTGSDVVIVMESGFRNLHEKLQSCAGSQPSIAIVLCSTYPPISTTNSYGALKVLYIPQPYGPHKISKALYNAFASQNLAENMIPEMNGDHKPGALTPLPAQQLKEPTIPLVSDTKRLETSDYFSPSASANPAHSFLPPIFDRRTSIDTSVIKSDGLRVLLVEDNEINLKLLVAYMRKLKLNHSTAINGLEAFNTYKEANGQFDVIFMDISMPIMDGIESTRHIRRFEREQALNPVSLIALTGAANPNSRQEAFSSGIDMFLIKPVPMKSLKLMLDDLTRNGRKVLTK